jgi:CheY-like chemotaxis protein
LADVVIREEAWAEWLAGERQRLEGLALDTLVTLGEAELALGHTDKALETVPRALAINNLREDAHRLMLRALAAAGRRAEALKHYEDFVALLKRELKTEPDAATKALAAELRSTPTVKAVTELARPSIAVPVAAAGRMAKVETPPAAVDEVTALMKVLVVDDHPLIREAALTMLNQLKRGTVVLEASSAQQTVEITEKHPDISLILLDITLPDRDGFSLLSELRDRYPATAIVVLSASQDQEEVQRAFSLGVLGYIPKTTRREVMLNAIELVLSGGLYIPSAVLEGERALSP